MIISKNNYEIYFIDYHDGNLSAEQTAELFLFLEKHPDLKSDFDNFSQFSLEAPDFSYPNRDSLKKGIITMANVDEKLIAVLEGDLSFEEKTQLEAFIKSNPEIENVVNLYKATVSVPDLSLLFPEKNKLKKPFSLFYDYKNEIRYGIAAIILLAFLATVVIVFNRTMEQKTKQVAGQKNTSAPVYVPKEPTKANSQQPQKTPVITDRKNLDYKNLTAEKRIPEHHNAPDNRHKYKPVTGITPGPMQLVESISLNQVPVMHQELIAADKQNYKSSGSGIATSSEHYMTIWEALRKSSEKNLKKIISKDNEALAYAVESADVKIRLVDVVNKGLGKISNDKVKLESIYNSGKQSRSFSFSAGNFKFERK